MEACVKGTVYYNCDLNEEDTRKVIDFAKENDMCYEQAVAQLYDNGEISLYDCSTESDYATESIEDVELNDDDRHYEEHGYFPWEEPEDEDEDGEQLSMFDMLED